jgi:hypothetical protein
VPFVTFILTKQFFFFEAESVGFPTEFIFLLIFSNRVYTKEKGVARDYVPFVTFILTKQYFLSAALILTLLLCGGTCTCNIGGARRWIGLVGISQ